MAVKQVQRFDAGQVVTTRKTPEGFLITEGAIAQPGIYTYEQADGSIIRELVDEDVLQDKAANDTLFGKAFTLEHPEDDVTPANWKDLAEGTVGQWRYDGKLYVALNVNTQKALDAIAGGKVELSPGYVAEVDDTPGTHPKFGEYDTKQVRRKSYNHVAAVDEARGGPELQIKRDSARQVKGIDMTVKTPVKTAVKKDAGEAEGGAAAGEQVAQDADGYDMRADMAGMRKDMGELKTALMSLIKALEGGAGAGAGAGASEVEDKADADGEKPADKACAGEDMPKKDAASWYSERRRLEEFAAEREIDMTPVMGKSNNLDWKRHIIKSIRPDFKRLDSKDAVNTAFDMIADMPSPSDMWADDSYAPSGTPQFKRKDGADKAGDDDMPDMRKRLGARSRFDK